MGDSGQLLVAPLPHLRIDNEVLLKNLQNTLTHTNRHTVYVASLPKPWIWN